MAYTLGGVTLPYGLLWVDEQAWTPYVQAQEYSLTGALILQYGEKQAGRPITLSGTDQRAWVTQDTLDDLRALLGIGELALVLPDTRAFTVIWNHSGPPILATPILDRWPNAGQKYSAVTLALIEV